MMILQLRFREKDSKNKGIIVGEMLNIKAICTIQYIFLF